MNIYKPFKKPISARLSITMSNFESSLYTCVISTKRGADKVAKADIITHIGTTTSSTQRELKNEFFRIKR